jgi:hypothetical protein
MMKKQKFPKKEEFRGKISNTYVWEYDGIWFSYRGIDKYSIVRF